MKRPKEYVKVCVDWFIIPASWGIHGRQHMAWQEFLKTWTYTTVLNTSSGHPLGQLLVFSRKLSVHRQQLDEHNFFPYRAWLFQT